MNSQMFTKRVVAGELMRIAGMITSASKYEQRAYTLGRVTFREKNRPIPAAQNRHVMKLIREISGTPGQVNPMLDAYNKGIQDEAHALGDAELLAEGLWTAEELRRSPFTTNRLRHEKLYKYGAGDRRVAKHPLDGVRRHTLMPRNIAGKLPKLYETEDQEDPVVWMKFFSPYGNRRWYITEFDGRDTMFGWSGGELGYISLNELESANRRGLPLVERDLSWRPVALSKAKGK